MTTMRALVLTGPRQAEIRQIPRPEAGPGQAVVAVHRVGLCGTDVAFFTGEMGYLATGQASYPLQIGHEWCGEVVSIGAGVDASWLGRRVTGDTMLGCQDCERCLRGYQHICPHRYEVGVLGGWPGAVAEEVMVPVTSLHELPDTVGDTAGALVEPGGNSARAIAGAGLGVADRVAVFGPGTIGLLAAAFAVKAGAEVHVVGRSARGLALARDLGVAGVWHLDELAELPGEHFRAVIDATSGAEIPAEAVELVEPGGRVVCVGLAARPSLIDTRRLVLKDVTVAGHLSGSPAIDETIAAYADGSVVPDSLVAATVPLERAGDVLAGWRPPGAGPGPKMHLDPRR